MGSMQKGSPRWDYVIVGSGSAGGVLAARLSEDPSLRVLLLEAGESSEGLLFDMPKGFGRLLLDPAKCWYFPIETEPGSNRTEVWTRGKALGGSSAINGELYHRGQPEDFEDWKALGNTPFCWTEMLRCFRAMERHELGETEFRGGNGQLRVSAPSDRGHPMIDAFIAAGREMGLPEKQDYNAPGDEGVGLFAMSIGKGRRASTASAFLQPARGRRNLEIRTGVLVERILFAGRRATGVRCRIGPDLRDIAAREVIVCAGGIHSPRLLQVSGVGAGEHLRGLGVEVVHDLPSVGRNLLEHRYLRLQYRLTRWASDNRAYAGPRLWLNALRWMATGKGPLGSGAFDAGISARSAPDVARADIQINMLPASLDLSVPGFAFEREPGFQMITYVMRPRSTGHVLARSVDPLAPPEIRANYMTDPYDREVGVRAVRYARRVVEQPALAPLVVAELAPGGEVRSDDDILAAYAREGGPCQHASSTCRMGTDDAAVVDPFTLRVRGVDGLRVVDGSIMPTMVSGNTSAPIMAMAWRASELIRAADQA